MIVEQVTNSPEVNGGVSVTLLVVGLILMTITAVWADRSM